MNSRVLIWSVVSFISGFVIHAVATFEPEIVPLAKRSTAHHWRRVREYNAFMEDRSNRVPVPGTDYMSITAPLNIDMDLVMLKKAREIDHVDLVFPLIQANSEAGRHWMKFTWSRRDKIIRATGNIRYVDYKTNGEQPLRLSLWFLKEAKPDIQQLIKELEAIAADEKLNMTPEQDGRGT